MTTISPNRRRRRVPARTLVYATVLLCILGGVSLLRTQAAGGLWLVGKPLIAIRTKTAQMFATLAGEFSGNAALVKENANLRDKLASAQVLLLDRDLLISQNNDLERRLGRSVSTSSTVVAAVMARPPAVPYDVFMLDVGQSDNIKKGDLVSAGGSTVIGTIDEVYPTTARAVLLSASGVVHDVLLISKSATIPMSVSGQGAGSFVGEVPTGATVSVGDIAVFPGISERLVARVSAVETAPGASFITVYLQFPINIFSLRFVEVYRQTSI